METMINAIFTRIGDGAPENWLSWVRVATRVFRPDGRPKSRGTTYGDVVRSPNQVQIIKWCGDRVK